MPRPTTTVEVVFDETPLLITGDVTRTNLITNPNFETDTTGWSSINGAAIAKTTAEYYSGTASLQITNSATNNSGASITTPVTSGQSYIFSAYMKAQTGTIANMNIFIVWLNSGGTEISRVTSSVMTATTTWQRMSISGTAPVGAVNAFLRFGRSLTGTAGTIWFADAFLFETGSTLLPYFDGTYADTYSGYALSRQEWSGTINNSTSTGYWASTTSSDCFTLDDSTKGVLNNPYYLLDGALTFSDVTARVSNVSVRRGRSRQLDQYTAGSATISFYDDDRNLDPLNTASPYYPNVIPRRYVRIKSNGIPIFAGLINSWEINYVQPQGVDVTAYCSDALAVLANQTINAYTPAEALSGARFVEVLNLPEINFTATSVAVDTGSSMLGAFPVSANTTALNYLQQIERSEQGYLYASANNTLKFKERASVVSQTGTVSFTDTGSGTSGYMTLDVMTGDELLYNRILTTSPAGAQQEASDATSITKYDIQTLEINDLLNSTTSEVLSIANLLLAQYANPEVRYTGITQELLALNGTAQNALLTLDLTDLVTVTRTYATGSPATVTKYVLIEGINHSITPKQHTVEYRLASLSQSGFVLNSGTFGLLDIAALT